MFSSSPRADHEYPVQFRPIEFKIMSSHSVPIPSPSPPSSLSLDSLLLNLGDINIFFQMQYFIYFGCAGSLLLCRLSLVVPSRGYFLAVSHCSGFSCCGAQALGYIGFNGCGTWAQQASALVAHGLSCPEACRVLLDQGLFDPCLLHWQADSLPLNHQGSLNINILYCILYMVITE